MPRTSAIRVFKIFYVMYFMFYLRKRTHVFNNDIRVQLVAD